MIYKTIRTPAGMVIHLDDARLPERGSELSRIRESITAELIDAIYEDDEGGVA